MNCVRNLTKFPGIIQPFRKYSQKPNDFLTINFENGVRTITMCDVKTRNALSIEMMENLVESIKENNQDKKLRAVVIGAIGNVFSAGHNLKELSSLAGKENHEKVFKLASHLMEAIIDSPVPIIAKVDGVAAAAGCQLVAQCDLAICSEKSTFMTPGVNFGIFCSTPGVALARTVPKSIALKMLLTGKPISAEEAKNTGLVTETCKTEELDKIIDDYCEIIKGKSREVLDLGKKFYYQQMDLNVKQAFKMGGNIMVENLQLNDGKEGIESFIEKRKAMWTHGHH